MSALAGAALAVSFLTRLPVPGAHGLDLSRLGHAVVWFPLVGAAVGGVVGGTRLLADLALPAGSSTVLALVAGILVTGGLHEDGLADTADGLGAHTNRQRKLEIMRDSRVGTYGALALITSFALAWSLLAGLDGGDCLLAAVAGHALARWAMPMAGAIFPPAREDGSGALLVVDRPRLALATILAGGVALAACGAAAAVAAIGVALAATLAVGSLATRIVGGLSGDVYGATGKAVELAVFAVLAVVWA